MPTLRNRPPKLCRKNSNDTGYVYWCGRQIYLGKWGEIAEKNYRAFLSRWASNPRTAGITSENSNVTLEILFSEFLTAFESRPGFSVSDRDRHRRIARQVLALFPHYDAEQFTQIELESVRDSFQHEGFIKDGEHHEYSYRYLNRIANFVRAVFKWGVTKRLVAPTVYENLKYLYPLRENEVGEYDDSEREAADEQSFEAILPLLLPVYRDILSIVRYSAMRPSEVCRMRICDILMDGEVWVYSPHKHKTKRRGKARAVALGKRSQEILLPRMKYLESRQYIFTAYDARIEKIAEQRRNRKTYQSPSQKKRDAEHEANRIREEKPIPVSLIDRAVKRAFERLGDAYKPFTPYCLRHLRLTEISLAEGIVASQRVAGHSSLQTTQIYDHSALQEAIRVARKYG